MFRLDAEKIDLMRLGTARATTGTYEVRLDLRDIATVLQWMNAGGFRPRSVSLLMKVLMASTAAEVGKEFPHCYVDTTEKACMVITQLLGEGDVKKNAGQYVKQLRREGATSDPVQNVAGGNLILSRQIEKVQEKLAETKAREKEMTPDERLDADCMLFADKEGLEAAEKYRQEVLAKRAERRGEIEKAKQYMKENNQIVSTDTKVETEIEKEESTVKSSKQALKEDLQRQQAENDFIERVRLRAGLQLIPFEEEQEEFVRQLYRRYIKAGLEVPNAEHVCLLLRTSKKGASHETA